MKHHLHRKHLAGALALLLGLLLLLHSCRKEHAVPTANVLASYKGSDKNVLKIIEELKKPENKELLATLNRQGEVDWQNYQAMLTSDFMQGLTLRFYQGPDSNYFDAQLNPETKDLRLLSKAQKLVEREHAIAQLKAESKAKEKAKTTYTSFACKAMVDFEYVLMTNRTTASVNDSFDYNYAVFTNIYYEFIQMVRRELLANGFALDPTYYMLYADDSISLFELNTQVIYQIRKSFENALADLRYSPVASGYYINGYLTKASAAPPTCTTLGGGGGGGGTDYDTPSEENDPDLKSDCGSWRYVPVGPDGNYQACGVSKIDLDYITTYKDTDGKLHVDYIYYKFNVPIFFEFPRIRSDGYVVSATEAAIISANLRDEAEKALEARLGYMQNPGGTVIENAYLQILSGLMFLQGGRVSRLPNYGPVPITPLRKGLFGGGC